MKCETCGVTDGERGAIVRQGPDETAPSCPECRGSRDLTFGYAGANSVDGTSFITMEVNGVTNGNVYLTADSAEHLVYSLLNAGVKIPKDFATDGLLRSHIEVLANGAADDVLDRIGAGDEGARDVVNLVVNVLLARIDNPMIHVDDAIRANYDPDEFEDGDVVSQVIGWCQA